MFENEEFTKLADAIRETNTGEYFYLRGLAKGVNFVASSGRGSNYIDLTLVDNTGEFRCRMFGNQNTQREDAQRINGHVVEMKAKIRLYDGWPRAEVGEAGMWTVLNDEQVKDWKAFAFNLSEDDVQYLTDYIEGYIDSMDGKGWLKTLVSDLFQKHVSDLAKLPAGHEWHHAYNGGLLRHIAEKLWFVAQENPFASVGSAYTTVYNRDLVIAGCILSDFDKIFDVTPFPKGEKSSDSRQRSTMEVFFREEVLPILAKLRKRKKNGCTEREALALEHILLAGSINATGRVNAYTVEADLVALGDRISAELDHFGCFKHQNYTRTDSEQYSKMLGRYIRVKD